MIILLVGNDKKILGNRQKLLQENFPAAKAVVFSDPLLAVKYSMEHTVNVVVSDFELRIIDGIQFINLLRNQNPAIIPILVENYAIHREDARELGIGYLTQPITCSAILALYEKMCMKNIAK